MARLSMGITAALLYNLFHKIVAITKIFKGVPKCRMKSAAVAHQLPFSIPSLSSGCSSKVHTTRVTFSLLGLYKQEKFSITIEYSQRTAYKKNDAGAIYPFHCQKSYNFNLGHAAARMGILRYIPHSLLTLTQHANVIHELPVDGDMPPKITGILSLCCGSI